MGSARRRTTILVLSIIASPLSPFAQLFPFAQVSLFAQVEDDEFRSGLIGSYSDNQGHRMTRRDATVSLHAGNGQIQRQLDADSLQVQWTGFLMSQAVGEYKLHVYGAGNIEIVLDGETVLKSESTKPEWSASTALPLQFDFHPVTIAYERNGTEGGIRLFWSGPQFQLEPISTRYLYHDPTQTPDASVGRGESIVSALRCAGCHNIPGQSQPANAPSLAHVTENMDFEWLVDWLAKPTPQPAGIVRRMPHFSLANSDAVAIAAYVFEQSKPVKLKPADRKKPDLAKGKQLLLATGCLACHRVGNVGESGLFGGGDLTSIAAKRPRAFFDHWLAAPKELNPQHRMPLFELSRDERRNLAAYLATLGTVPERSDAPRSTAAVLERGRELFTKHQCAACHDNEKPNSRPALREFTAAIKWDDSCAGAPNEKRPGYQLSGDDRKAVVAFVADATKHPNATPRSDARQILAEQNCLACHLRGDAPGLAANLPAVAEAHPELAALLPAMTPPPLISVGDKLYEQSIRDAILRKSVHRDYLLVRMPKFNLSDEQLQTLVDYFVQSDRVPPRTDQRPPPTTDPLVLHAVGSRLVTTDGFGCTSCHQLGSVRPVKAPLNARGPQLTSLAKRIRREWFERFVRNPLRVIPRMEMPSVQVAVSGILDDHLDTQLAAVWDVLNDPDFEPPLPDPVRVVRHSGLAERDERSVVITDVVRSGEQSYLKPLLLGLPNRTSFLFDLERAALVQWSIGNVAQERTEGKTWFWTTAGTQLLKTELTGAELALIRGNRELEPQLAGQFVTEFDEVFHTDGNGIGFRYRLHFMGEPSTTVSVTQTFAVDSYETGTVSRQITCEGLPASSAMKLRLLASGAGDGAKLDANILRTRFGSLDVAAPLKLAEDFTVTASGDDNGRATIGIVYRPHVPLDIFPTIAPKAPAPPPLELDVVPGFSAVRLPISNEFMPTGLAWRPRGDLVVGSLKGRVWNLRDTDDDGLEDEAVAISDELAAPYGVAAYDEYVDVVTKYGLLRLHSDRMETIASGWGHTTDYHDWVVGLPRDDDGNYYIALPCQQD